MCTTAFAFGVHPTILFILAFNRDEFLDRPTQQAHWWEDEKDILAGRDLVRKGTWLGVSRAGRIAFLTNFREVQPSKPFIGPSRGELVTAFLSSSLTPSEYLQQIDLDKHSGCNLVVGDLTTGQVVYKTNRGSEAQGPIFLQKGIHSLSNGVLSSTWPKTVMIREHMKDLLNSTDGTEPLSFDSVREAILGSCEKPSDNELPQTGMPQEVEREFSSVYIEKTDVLGKPYGTQTQTYIVGRANNEVEYIEEALYPANSAEGASRTSSFTFTVPITAEWRTELVQ